MDKTKYYIISGATKSINAYPWWKGDVFILEDDRVIGYWDAKSTSDIFVRPIKYSDAVPFFQRDLNLLKKTFERKEYRLRQISEKQFTVIMITKKLKCGQK